MTKTIFHDKLVDLAKDLNRFAYQLTANKEDTKDLVQETFLKALKYYSSFVYESNLKAWAFTIMKNTFINGYRRSLYRNTYCDHSIEGFILNNVVASSSFHPDSEYTSKELEGTINALNDVFKIPFKMHCDGFLYKEIAESLDIKEGTVKSRIFLARKQLREQVAF